MNALRDEVGEVTLVDPRETQNIKPLKDVIPISIHIDYPNRHVMIGIKLSKELRSATTSLHGYRVMSQA